jgi:hypothetical protein
VGHVVVLSCGEPFLPNCQPWGWFSSSSIFYHVRDYTKALTWGGFSFNSSSDQAEAIAARGIGPSIARLDWVDWGCNQHIRGVNLPWLSAPLSQFFFPSKRLANNSQLVVAFCLIWLGGVPLGLLWLMTRFYPQL